MAHKIFNYNGQDVYLEVNQYQNNGALAVCMCYPNGELYDVISVNLRESIQSDSMAFLDTNNHPNIEKFIKSNGLGTPMGLSVRSGFCSYPLYTFYTSNF